MIKRLELKSFIISIIRVAIRVERAPIIESPRGITRTITIIILGTILRLIINTNSELLEERKKLCILLLLIGW